MRRSRRGTDDRKPSPRATRSPPHRRSTARGQGPSRRLCAQAQVSSAARKARAAAAVRLVSRASRRCSRDGCARCPERSRASPRSHGLSCRRRRGRSPRAPVASARPASATLRAVPLRARRAGRDAVQASRGRGRRGRSSRPTYRKRTRTDATPPHPAPRARVAGSPPRR